MGEDCLPHDIWYLVPPGKRRHGLQRVTLGRYLVTETVLLKLSLEYLWSSVLDKSSWRGTVVALWASKRGKTSVSMYSSILPNLNCFFLHGMYYQLKIEQVNL
jgi:hypothetical protein